MGLRQELVNVSSVRNDVMLFSMRFHFPDSDDDRPADQNTSNVRAVPLHLPQSVSVVLPLPNSMAPPTHPLCIVRGHGLIIATTLHAPPCP